jgi:ElaB/YqjD/DUF883 family membrane-anchored ribosome-binding protein
VRDSSLQNVSHDIEKFVKDAQTHFNEALTLSGDKALEAQKRGMRLLDTALGKAEDARSSVMHSGREMAASADHYVKENPWRTVTAAASIGLLLGVILGRK